jgi:hypothetical protein
MQHRVFLVSIFHIEIEDVTMPIAIVAAITHAARIVKKPQPIFGIVSGNLHSDRIQP